MSVHLLERTEEFTGGMGGAYHEWLEKVASDGAMQSSSCSGRAWV